MRSIRKTCAALAALFALLLGATAAVAAPEAGSNGRGPAGRGGPPPVSEVVGYWTPQRMAAAVPRDLVLDQRGLGYLRRPNGSLEPYGHSIAPLPANNGNGNGNGNVLPPPPVVTISDPSAGAELTTTSHLFAANVTSTAGLRSVTFEVQRIGGTTTSLAATSSGGATWTATVGNLSDGSWRWRVAARDTSRGQGQTTTTPWSAFTVTIDPGEPDEPDPGEPDEPDPGEPDDPGPGDPPDPEPFTVVGNQRWTAQDTVRSATGRVYFAFANHPNGKFLNHYICSGTVVDDGVAGRSLILTAAHCAYDDVSKKFATNVLFIPDQDATNGSSSDRNCANDPYGCWAPTAAIVDRSWTTTSWPNNIAVDYAFYVVPDTGRHTPGFRTGTSAVLDTAVGSIPVSFTAPALGTGTYGIGYPGANDPQLRYCADLLATPTLNSYGGLWLDGCGLTGGASGGPWLQPGGSTIGAGPIVSVNSYGYTNRVGMGGPRLHGTSAACLYSTARTAAADTAVTC